MQRERKKKEGKRSLGKERFTTPMPRNSKRFGGPAKSQRVGKGPHQLTAKTGM